MQYTVTPYVSMSVFVIGLGCRMHVYNTELHFSQNKTAHFMIQNCTFHNTQLYKTTLFTIQDCTFSQDHTFSQNKTALVTIQNRTCHNTKPHLSQYKTALFHKTALVTIQNCTCHNTKLHFSQDSNTKRFKRCLF